jgi:hypothetical protein
MTARMLGITMKRYLTAKETAEIRRKSEPALSQERKRGSGPPYVIDGGRVLYPEDELIAWLDARLVTADAV